ncbi:Mariner Mos1 transposase [Araneus ventricosus]|uniref:Mariner Mos1 transposase n=1 Tax=Araneus ventricosus TaxID=182803 RepID=A0A4Y2T3X9_ARAVE|nr:Mariner Mos1 transposase [Araneus ventricosus]
MLMDVHKTKRFGSTLTFLTRYSEEGNEFLNKIVTGDENWVCHVTPESKQQSMEWRHSRSHTQKNSKHRCQHTKSCALCYGMDRHGILLVEFLPRGKTINAVRYCETLRKLRCTIQNKIRGMLSQSTVLPHDNARPHSAGVTQNLIQQFGLEEFDHPPYSPNLAPSDYHLFLNLKRDFGGKRFDSDGCLHWRHLSLKRV